MIREEDAIRLTLDKHGVVWYSLGTGPPECSGVDAPRFLQQPVWRRASVVRIAGIPAHATMIASFWHYRSLGVLAAVQVCSSVAYRQHSSRREPAADLIALRTVGDIPSLGGWADLTAEDLSSYLLAHVLFSQASGLSGTERRQKTEEVLLRHRAWHALSFVSGLAKMATAHLFASVLDPRFYVDPKHPDRSARFEAYLGVNPELTAKALLNYDAATLGTKRGRCNDACRAWEGGLRDVPGGFIVRRYLEFNQTVEHNVRGSLEATKLFVQFMRNVWLASIYADTPGAEELFVPEYFFTEPETAKAFRQHCGTTRLTV